MKHLPLTAAMALLSGILAVLPPSVSAQRIDDSLDLHIDSVVRAAKMELGLPGISVAVGVNGAIRYLRSFGFADLENAVLARPATAYRTASVAKPFTATAVLQLVARDRIDLDRSIRAYVPALPESYRDVTVRDLLRHTGGVRHYAPGEFISTRSCARLADALLIFAADPLEHAPGEKITYSSYGYTLLGLAIEAVSGMSYESYVKRHVFEPAGMTSTRVDDRSIIPHRAEGYTSDDDGLRNAPMLDTSCRVPAGGFVSTAEDLVRFGIALDAGRLLNADLVAAMTSSQLTPDMIVRTLTGIELPPGYVPPGMGFGWAIPGDGGAAYHGGNQPGVTALLHHDPDRHITVALMANLDGHGDAMTELARAIAESVAQHWR